MSNFLRASLLVCAAAVGLTAGACGDDEQDEPASLRQELTCRDYCDRAKECNDEVNRQECVEKCLDRVDDCMADEQDAALDQIDECAAESCDDFIGCTVDAGAQCYFGL